MSEDNALGPVDFVLLEFPDSVDPSGATAGQLRALVEAGTIRLFDIVAVRKNSDGLHSVFDLGELSTDGQDGFAFFAGARSGLLSDDDVTEAARTMQNGTVAVALVYENAWAEPFVAAARTAGGSVIAAERIPAQDLLDVLDALDASETK